MKAVQRMALIVTRCDGDRQCAWLLWQSAGAPA